MSLKKSICLILFAAAVLTAPVALDRCQRDGSGKTWADGGAPPAPPIPLAIAPFDSPQLNADGGAPPAPPIPLAITPFDSPQLSADGGAPPAPPIPLAYAGAQAELLRA